MGGRRRYHPRPWEIEVQKIIRAHPIGENESLLLGLERDRPSKIGGAVMWAEEDGTTDVLIEAIAIADHRRHCGGKIADEAVNVAMQYIEMPALDIGAREVRVSALVDRKNESAQALFYRFAFRNTGDWGDELDRWTRDIALLE